MRLRFGAPVTGLILLLPLLLANLSGLRSYFVGDDFDFLVRMKRLDGPFDVATMAFWGEWEPVWYLGFYRDLKIWGDQAFGYHLANFVWMAVAVVALFAVMRRLLPEAQLAPWAAALGFAAHPLHDEAVTYIAARGHTMAAALSLVGLLAYLHARVACSSRGRRGWWTIALVAIFLAVAAKETAIVVPLWIGWIEWGVFRGGKLQAGSLLAALRRSLIVMLPCVAYLALRFVVVGGSDKLAGPDGGLWSVLQSLLRNAPEYSLIGAMPFPFAFALDETVESFRPLGWLLFAGWFVPPLAMAAWRWSRERAISPRMATYLLGLTIATSGLMPVFWAELGVKRRYFFVPSIGLVICAAILFERLYQRRRRLALTLCVLLSLIGFVGLAYRNELYRQAGEVTRSLVELARRDAAAGPLAEVGLVTLPRFYGGDGLSGAYVLHYSDAVSALRYAGLRFSRYSIGSQCDFAEDYRAELVGLETRAAYLDVRFAGDAAFRASQDYDPQRHRRGRMVRMERGVADETSRSVAFPLTIPWELESKPFLALYVYSDRRFQRWPPVRAAVRMQQGKLRDETSSAAGR